MEGEEDDDDLLKSDEYKGVLFDATALRVDEIIELCKTHIITHISTPYFSDNGVTAIVPLLFTRHLQHLELHCTVSDAGAHTISNHLKRTSLSYLYLRCDCPLEYDIMIHTALIDCNFPNFTLELYYIFKDYSVTVAELISKCTGMVSLQLPSDSRMGPIFPVLKRNTTLRELIITNNYGAFDQLVEECFEENTTIVKGSGPCGITRNIIVNQLCQELGASERERRSIPKQLNTKDEIEAFLRELIQAGTEMNSLKLAVLGHGEVGKTTLLNCIRVVQEQESKKKQWFFVRFKGHLFPSRTVGIDHSILVIKDGKLYVWDFGGQLEYAVTHQFFLSNEMVVYIICYDASQTPEVQTQQISYWLDFLASALPLSNSSSSRSKWRVILVGTKLDKSTVDSNERQDDLIQCWQANWPQLPIHPTGFLVSSHDQTGVLDVLTAIEEVCNSIFQRHTLRIPQSYKTLLESLQTIPVEQSIVSVEFIAQNHAQGMDQPTLLLALKYLHATGRIVLLMGDLVCTSPQTIPKLAAQFISPSEVRMKTANNNRVEVLQAKQIGTLLKVHNDAQKLQQEIKVLETIGVCFDLGGNQQSYLFPSLASKTSSIKFSIADAPHLQLAALRFVSPQGTIFVPGFFCQLIVTLFRKLNISQQELIEVHSNCVTLTCSGVFIGELLVTLEDDAKSIVVLMKATNPDLSIVKDVFSQAASHSPQYQASVRDVLCPTCVNLSYFTSPPQFPHDAIGVADFASLEKKSHESGKVKTEVKVDDEGDSESETDDENSGGKAAGLFCKPRVHLIESFSNPKWQYNSRKVKAAKKRVLDVTICWSHHRPKHHFFLNYRVATEGKKSSSLSSENECGLVEVIYRKIATTKKKKNGKPLFVFWDKKCLNYGQNWENGFLHGLKSSKVILLLISHQVIEGIAKNAPNRYECAILLNVLYGTPVLPIFAAEMSETGDFKRFEYGKASELLPETQHQRKANAQRVINELSESLPDFKKSFVGSIKATVEKVSYKLSSHINSALMVFCCSICKECTSPREEKILASFKHSWTWQ